MTTSRRFLSGLILAVLGAVGAPVYAAGGQVQNLSGTLSVQRPDGSVRILSQKSEVNPGEVLTTQRDSYAQINFTDGSSMTMRPNTQMKIETYQFDEAKPQEDNALFRLIKGGLRTVTGLVGKRGNQDAYRIGTATATIGIRGSSGETLDCTQGCDGVVAGGDKVQRGVYHTTYTGSYIMQNEGGSQIIGEGQFGFVRDSTTAPQILPKDPGLNLKDLPTLLGVNFKQGEDCIVK
jgi:FecR protein